MNELKPVKITIRIIKEIKHENTGILTRTKEKKEGRFV